MLTGKEKGYIVPYKEVAGGASASAGLGIELGRIDFYGPENKFSSKDLFGIREKVWGSSPFSDVAYSWGNSHSGYKVEAQSVSLGISISPFGGFGGGYNLGEMKPW